MFEDIIVRSEYLFHISHVTRTHVNAILSAAELGLQIGNKTPEIEEALLTICDSSELLLSTINDLLDLSAIETGRLELSHEKFDIPSLVNDTMQLSLVRLSNKPIEFLLSIDENTPYYLYGDEYRIKQILYNILSNAFKFTNKGKVELKIKVETSTELETIDSDAHTNCSLVLSVKDTGLGMTKEQIDNLFDKYTLHNLDFSRATVGTGLGISITKRLVDAMNGEIYVESTPGVGSAFTVRLPLAYIGTARCGAELADELRGRRFNSMYKSKKVQIDHEFMPYGSVLIVDDFESNRNAAKSIMVSYGLNIDTAVSGFEAIDKIASGLEYDIVFMDYMMPKMDGLETTIKIREMGYKHPVVALTAHTNKGQAELFMASGCDRHMYKPLDVLELDTLLMRLIRDKQTLEVLAAAREELRKRKADAISSSVKSEAMVDELVAAVVCDAENVIAVFKDLLPRMTAPCDADLELYTATAHGISSALSNIEEAELCRAAYTLEKAGANKVVSIIQTDTPEFIDALQAFIDRSKPADSDDMAQVSSEDENYLLAKMGDIKKACEALDVKAAKSAMADLKKKTWSRKSKVLIEEVSVNLLRGDFDKVISNIEELL